MESTITKALMSAADVAEDGERWTHAWMVYGGVVTNVVANIYEGLDREEEIDPIYERHYGCNLVEFI